MQKKTRATMLVFAIASFASSSWASREGVDYVVESDVIVFGGSFLWARTQNPVDAQTLYAERLGTRARNTLYRGEGTLSDVQASPKGSFVAVREGIWQENVSPDRATYVDRRVGQNGHLQEFYHFEESRLHILSLDGAVIDTIKNVRRFAWDPGADRIAYVSGDYSEKGLGFVSTGTWIYELSSKQARRIHPGGVDVQWAAWDGNVYVYDPFSGVAPKTRVFRFETNAQQLVPTSHKGIFFSADGAHYYVEEPGAAVKVFRTDSDEPVTIELPDQGNRKLVAYRAAGWLGDATLILPSPVAGDQGDYLYDVRSGTTRHAAGKVMPSGADDRVLVLEGESFSERRLNELALPQ